MVGTRGRRAREARPLRPYDVRVKLNLSGASARTAAVAIVIAGMLAGCSGANDTLAAQVTGQLPDLTENGFTSFTCGDGEAIGDSFQQPEGGDFDAVCWKGAPAGTYLDAANTAQDRVIEATGGTNVTAEVCPEDALSAAGGIACRAVRVDKDGETVLVRTVAVLADPTEVLGALPADPTQEQIQAALAGAKVELLIGTEPLVTNPVEPTPTS